MACCIGFGNDLSRHFGRYMVTTGQVFANSLVFSHISEIDRRDCLRRRRRYCLSKTERADAFLDNGEEIGAVILVVQYQAEGGKRSQKSKTCDHITHPSSKVAWHAMNFYGA